MLSVGRGDLRDPSKKMFRDPTALPLSFELNDVSMLLQYPESENVRAGKDL